MTATNALGAGPASAASNAVTPTAPASAPVALPAPKLTVRALKTKLKLAAFLKGVRFTVTPNQPVSLRVSLLASVNRATIARAFPLVLATNSIASSAARRTVTIVPSKKLVGRPRKATVELVIVATGATGRPSTTVRQIRLTR